MLNIGNHRAEEVRTLVALLERALGRAAVVRSGARPAADVQETFAAVEAIGALTGFAPRTSLAEGIRRFAAWFKAFHGSLTVAQENCRNRRLTASGGLAYIPLPPRRTKRLHRSARFSYLLRSAPV